MGFLVILSVIAALGIYSTLKLDQLNQIIQSISSVDNEIARLANRLKNAVLTQRKFDRMYVVSKDPDFYSQFMETSKYIDKDLKEIGTLLKEAGQSSMVAPLMKGYNQYLSVVEEESRLIRNQGQYSKGNVEKKKAVFAERIISELEALAADAESSIKNKIELSGQIGSQASRVVVILTIASVVMGFLIAFYNARTINRPVVSLIKGTKAIAEGNFEKHIHVPSPPEINELAQAFNHMCDRLQELDQMKADLVSHISHEFRTPLAVIREAVHLHRECISSGPVEKQQKLLAITDEECERLIGSVNKVLHLSRMNGGIMDYHMEECSISQLIEMGSSKIAPIAERKKISLEVDFPDNLPEALIDKEKIGQVLDNLLDNALKFTQEGGKIVIKAGLAEQKGKDPVPGKEKRFVEISVSDTGCGIPDDSFRTIFDKFNKLHESGTGLGLYIAQQMVRAHGGDIWVKSEENRGSTFFFTVPVS